MDVSSATYSWVRDLLLKLCIYISANIELHIVEIITSFAAKDPELFIYTSKHPYNLKYSPSISINIT